MSRRFYFAYHEVHGLVFPFSWMEDNGEPVGGIPSYFLDSRVEITEKEFNSDLSELERKHPLPLDNPISKVLE